MGTTASGKTDLAEALATRLEAQLINADAFQVYRGMDIGTAKPDDKSRYLLLDLKEPNEQFGLGEWIRLTVAELERLYSEGRDAIVVGGSGLYIRALMEGYGEMYGRPTEELREKLKALENESGLVGMVAELSKRDPSAAAIVDLRNPARVRRALEKVAMAETKMTWSIPSFEKKKIAIELTPEETGKRIVLRAQSMVQNGWAQETASLLAKGFGPEDPGFRAHGYKAMCRVVRREIELDEGLATTIAEVQRYAKRQRTWLRKEPGLEWMPSANTKEMVERALNLVLTFE